ncbi:hypothetical protein HMPREF9413_4262 [Paenibacillus sp. HGF7]|nr:hypothetical protein HMPREF9413_4262 [Paenibacillus sp. HGF7]
MPIREIKETEFLLKEPRQARFFLFGWKGLDHEACAKPSQSF